MFEATGMNWKEVNGIGVCVCAGSVFLTHAQVSFNMTNYTRVTRVRTRTYMRTARPLLLH